MSPLEQLNTRINELVAARDALGVIEGPLLAMDAVAKGAHRAQIDAKVKSAGSALATWTATPGTA